MNQTLVDLLCGRAAGSLARRGYTFFVGDEADDSWLRYIDLHQAATEIAGSLWKTRQGDAWVQQGTARAGATANGTSARRVSQSRDRASTGAALFQATGWETPPPRVVILAPPGPSYLKALFGTFYSGLVAVTAYPPRARRRDQRLDRVISDSGASIALVDRTIMQRRDQILRASPGLAELEWIDVDNLPGRQVERWSNPMAPPESLAILQYTSGSTSHPKGVCLTHQNLMANLQMIYQAFEVERHGDPWSVTWLPPYHDMGLIGGILQVMYAGKSTHVLPPAAFVQKPIRWLRAIDRYRASVSGGPNFAFDTCVQKIDRSQIQSLDLSCWTLAFTGAEPIRRDTLCRFAETFAACGFSSDAFFPCYGLAEATLMVSGGPRRRPLRIANRDDEANDLSAINRAALVSCGRVVSGTEVRIVDPETERSLDEGQVGEIWVSGPSISPGYWNKPEANDHTFGRTLQREPTVYLRTGDLGFLRDGELFVCGRMKELIVIRGRNFFPADLEAAASECSDRLVPNAAAAFEAFDSQGEVGLVLVLETAEPCREAEATDLIARIREALVDGFELDPLQIVLIEKRSLPKTSSGKVKRLDTKRQFQQGTLKTVATSRKLPAVTSDAPHDGDGTDQRVNGEATCSAASRTTARNGVALHRTQASQPPRGEREIQQWLVQRLARQLDVAPDSIDASRPFVQYGLDSVSAVQITSELESFLGCDIPATLFYEAPNIQAVARSLCGTNGAATDRPSTSAAETQLNDRGAAAQDRSPSVAIVGMACRLPGCVDRQAFWKLLCQGGIAVGAPPTWRHDCVTDDVSTLHAGWIDDPELFDASLFGISPREAKWIDPQHRLLLETCWRAIEDAGLDPKRLAGSRTGAFVGISNRDYERRILRNHLERSTYAMTGNAASMAAHRLSFHLDLQGPSLAIDTACSSSLVALHQAVRSIQSGDCDASLVAGVNLILSPEVSETLSVSEMLSPDGLCKTFDAAANGYVRGEGCVALLLKPLAQALADGDPIQAVIRGTAVNQDGQTNGITAPNGDSQVRLYRQALADARLSPEAITHIEAHGTGTPLGDPIEVRSLIDVYGARSSRSGTPASACHLGAVKANVGHLEAAAGLAGVLKVVLELQHGQIAPQPNFSSLNPEIDLRHSRMHLSNELVDWSATQPRIAAVSSFGFGGTNAHVILSESLPVVAPIASETENRHEAQLVPLSAFDLERLRETAADHADFFERERPLVGDFASATQQQKTSHRYRLAVIADRPESVVAPLKRFASGTSDSALHVGVAPADHPLSLAFLFSGQGGQHLGMGRDLYRRSRVFRQWVDDCDDALQDQFGYRIAEAIRSDHDASGSTAKILSGPGSQAALFVLQLALARTLEHLGIRSNIVLGHSLGEYAAAVVAGVMQWQDGLTLTAARAQRIAELPDEGAMTVIFASVESVQRDLRSLDSGLCVAAIDGPEHVVVSGPASGIRSLQTILQQRGTETRPLRIPHAFHSALIEPALDTIASLVPTFELARPQQTYISALTGLPADEELLTADYWVRHSRQPVRYQAAQNRLAAEACDVAVEIGPHPTLCQFGKLSGPSSVHFLPTLHRNRGDWLSILETLAELYVHGAAIQWDRLREPGAMPVRRLHLPGHPLHRKRYWIEESANDHRLTAPVTRGSVAMGDVGRHAEVPCIDVVQRLRADRAGRSDDQSSDTKDLQRAAAALPDIGRLVAWWMQSGLARLGIGLRPQEQIAPETIVAHGPVLAKHQRLLRRICEILQEDGWLAPLDVDQDGRPRLWQTVRPLHHDSLEIDHMTRACLDQHAAIQHEIKLVSRCGLALPQVFSGQSDPLSVLFPDGDTSDLEQLYRNSAVARCCNRLVAETARAVVTMLRQQTSGSDRRPLRVLEIGAGTGGTTSFVLPAIKSQIDQYVFTDASPLLIADSSTRFGNEVAYEVLDIETEVDKQGFEPHSFDLVLAANVLHATKDLSESLHNAQRLLASGGFLIALEGVRRERLLDLIFGMTEGWWRFEDTQLRPDYPLLTESQWIELLRQQGYADPMVVPFPESTTSPRDSQIVLLAGAGHAEASTISPSVFRSLSAPANVDDDAALLPSIEAFRTGDPQDRREALEHYLRHRVAAVLGHTPEELDLDQPVSNLGIDSLMAIQLKNRLDKDLGISIPMVAFLQGKTVHQLIEVALKQDDRSRHDPADQPTGDQFPKASRSSPSASLAMRSGNGTSEGGTDRDWYASDGTGDDWNLPSASGPGVDRTAVDRTAVDRAEGEPPTVASSPATAAQGADDPAQESGQRVLGPMSVGQLALWMIHQRAPQGPAYNFAFAARTTRAIDLSALTKACQSLIKRHPVLRTRYRLQDNAAVRVLSDSTAVAIDEKDCRDWKESRVIEWIRQESDRPFDLQHGPVIRFSLLRCRPGDVLAISMHHIAADLWSMDVLIQELIDLYAMIVGGGSIELGPLPTTYDAYVQWERELDHSDEGARLWDFWRRKLEGAPVILSLPTTYPRPTEQTYQGNSLEWTLPPEVVEGLREVAQAERTTMFTIVLAAYQVFLSRICNQDDLLVGTVSASRGRSEWEGIVGYFLNQLVLRTRIVGSPTFRDVLRDSQREVLDALEHQAFPFAKLVEKIRPPRDASRSPLVQTMFIWDKPRHLKESHFSPGKSSDRLRLKPLLMEQRGAPFDLTLIVFELEDELKLAFRYNTDLFSHEAIATLGESLQAMMEVFANDPDTPVRFAPLMTASQESLIASWNATDTPFDPTLSGDALFRKWVRETPEAMAIESGNKALTYRQADQRVERFALALLREGVRPGDTVGLLVPRGIDAVLAILATWRVGAAYVPLDPDHPASRLDAICQDAKLRLLLTLGDLPKEKSLELSCPTANLRNGSGSHDQPTASPTSKPTAFPAVDPDAPAYLIFTSGSTGRPKGVVLPHRGVANLAVAQRNQFKIRPSDRCLQFASLSFDASVFEIMMAFHAGACLHVLDSASIRSTTGQIADRLRHSAVTVATLPPSVLAALPSDRLPDLRIVVSAGEACSAALVHKWAPGREMFNAYGPTETTVWATTERCVPDGRDPTLGRPIDNVQLYVVDQNLEPVPIGVAGELCISGPGLAMEYRNLPTITSDAFVPNPFDDRYDATMYRTGDRGRWTADGKLEFLGRIDDQLKIDGHRIEPGEIASAIRQLDSVENAVVSAIEHAAGSQLVAYYTLASSADSDSVTEANLRQNLLTRLPAYMVPKRFLRVETFPLTINGKVDTARLPKPDALQGRRESESPEPSTETERVLAAIWQEVLQIDHIGIDDNFFDLGGASLQALQAAELASRRGYPVSAETMFQFQTIGELAHQIDQVPSREAAGSVASERAWSQPTAASESLTIRTPSEPTLLRMVVESLGTYLPPRELTTDEVVRGCKRRLDFPLQRMTGIQSRHVAGDGEFSIDLALKAAHNCLANSRFQPEQIDLLIACNISRYDGPDFEISYEPSTASKLKQQLGASSARAFDVCNACAGFFTGLAIAEAELLSGRARRVMVVSGEYITHLTNTAQLELDGFLDPRLACLTLGDAGAAVMVELADDGSGFETLDLYTAGAYHDLCVAKSTDQPHGGAIMLTDAIKASAVTLDHSVSHAHRVLQMHHWKPEDVQHLIMHQTSSTTLDGAIEELNRFFGKPVCDHNNTINNLVHRGNTASTTHWIAVMDAIRSGRIHSGDQAVFAVSGSGQTIGTALYRFDTLPERLTHPDDQPSSVAAKEASHRGMTVQAVASHGVRIRSASVDPRRVQTASPRAPFRVVESACGAAKACLADAGWLAEDVQMLIHTGIFRDDFLSEPAVAAIVAGELRMNHERPEPNGKRTLAFDLSDSGRGTITAMDLVSNMMRHGNLDRALITASEVENNPSDQPQRRITEMGSAIALESTNDPNKGLMNFSAQSYPQYADRLWTATKMNQGRSTLRIHRSDDLEQVLAECLANSVLEHLHQYSKSLDDFTKILVACPLDQSVESLARQLDIDRERLMLARMSDGTDPFTSAIALLWSEATIGFAPTSASESWLMVSAGAGIETACCEYHFDAEELTS